VVATLGLGIAVAFFPGDAALAVDVWLLVVGTLALLLAIARTLGALPPERPTRLDAAPPGLLHQTRPRELAKLEREVGLSTETAFDAYYRLRPTVSLLGSEAWNLVRADLARPRDHDAPGLTLDEIAVVVDAVEAL
jgi:hypothetical protein